MTLPPRVAVFGGTGLVGGHLVALLAAEEGAERIAVPSRRPVARWDDLPGVEVPVVDFDELSAGVDRWAGDQLFLCLGTTMKKAGSREAFRRVDQEMTLDAARLACEAGARDAFLVSSSGADPGSSVFYLQVKGETEEALRALPFRSVHVLRPSLLTGDRDENRPGEQVGALVGSLLRPLLRGPLRRYRPVAARTVARAMVALALEPGEGHFVHESDALERLGSGG